MVHHILYMKKSYFLAGSVFMLIGFSVAAQDTTRKREVNVTSTFKPVLKEAAKINFSATPPAVDTTRPSLNYRVPNQNLSFQFQPGSLRPLALQVDTGGRWNNESFVKAGFGNLSTPYAQVGLSLGDGKTAGLNLYGKHTSSNGKLPFQNYRHTHADARAFLQTGNNLEWNGRFGIVQERFNKYGFQPDTLKFPEDSLRVKYQTIRSRIAFHNLNKTAFGLSYAPEIKFEIFNDGLQNSESNTYFNFPVQKTVGKSFLVDLALEGNLTRYKPQKKDAINNSFILLAPSLHYKTPNIRVQAGLKPAWDNGEFRVLPNFMAEVGSGDQRFAFQLGWIAHLRSTGFQYLANFNPWIWAPQNIYNTRIEERYAGFKGSMGDHFTYAAKAGFHKIFNQPLFLNDSASGKSFVVVNEPQLNVFHIGGELGYTVGERFSLITNLKINNFTKLKEHDRAWGLLPLELRSTMRIQVLKDLYVNGDLYAFGGSLYKNKSGDRKRLDGAADLSAGLEFAVAKNIKLWAQFNNIFNQPYQRWNQYPVYGINFLGGVVFSFAQNKNQ